MDWLRHEYGLPAQIIPPTWHRHPELLWELSALCQHWLFCYDPQAKGNQALAWHHDFTVARERLRDWVTISGTRLDRDRPTRITLARRRSRRLDGARHGRDSVTARTSDFLAFVEEQVKARQQEQAATIQEIVNTDWSDRP